MGSQPMRAYSRPSNCGRPMAGRSPSARCQAAGTAGLAVLQGPLDPRGAGLPGHRLCAVPWAGHGRGRWRGTMSTGGSPVRAYDFLLKFLLVGDSDVGKGEILASLQDGAAESPYGHPAGERRAGMEWGWSARGLGRRGAQTRELGGGGVQGRRGEKRGWRARGLRRGVAGPARVAKEPSKRGRGGTGSRRGAFRGRRE